MSIVDAVLRCWVIESEMSFIASVRSVEVCAGSKSRGGTFESGSEVEASALELAIFVAELNNGDGVGGSPGDVASRLGDGGASAVERARLTRRDEMKAKE